MGHLPAILISVLLFSLTVLFFSLSFKQRREIAFYNGPAVKTKKEEIYREQLLI